MAIIYIDPTSSTNGVGSFVDPKNTWVGVTWVSSDTYLQKENTTYIGSSSIALTQNNIVLGTYDATTGVQIQDNTRHATITNTSGQGVNTNNTTGAVIDNLKIIANSSSGNAIQSLYTNSSTALNLTVRRCILIVPSGGGSLIRGRGDGVLVEDCEGDHNANSAAMSLTCINVTFRRTTICATQGTAVSIASTADDATTTVNVLIEDNCNFNSTGSGGASGGDALFIKGKNVIIRGLVSKNAWDNSLLLRCQNILVENCYFSNFDLQRTAGDGIQLVGTHDVLTCIIKNNIIIGHSDSPIKQCIIIGDSGAGSQTGPIVISDNLIVGMAFGLIVNTPGAKVLRNLVTGATDGGIVLSANSVEVANNLVININGVGIGTDPTFSGGAVVGNTVSSTGSCLKPGSTNTTYYNNLCINTTNGNFISDSTGLSFFNYNYYNGTGIWLWNNVAYTTFNEYKIASSQDTNSNNSNALISSSYYPRFSSPLIGAGTFLKYSRDIEGTQRNTSPTIGAYEYTSERAVR